MTQALARASAQMPQGTHEKTVVIVSPFFPPSTLAGVHRARHLAKHLPAAGWHPIVLCVDEAFHAERLDPDLAALVPASVEVKKVDALPVSLMRKVGVGDLGIRAWTHLREELFRLLQRRKVDVVLITGSPFYPMLMAPEIRRRFGIPVVLDFQDPWVSNWGAAQSRLSKAGVAQSLARVLEPRAVRGADFVTSVSDEQNEDMRRRYPWLSASDMAAIPIGGDPEDFAALRANGVEPDGGATRGRVQLSYVGTALPRSGALFSALLRAFSKLRAVEPDLGADIRLNFVGTSNQPNAASAYRIRPLALAEDVADAVHEIPHRVPYLEALSWLARSDGLLLIGSDEPHYTASKIYPALMSGRPFLSLFHRASSAHAILKASGGGRALAFADMSELAMLEDALVEALRALASSPQALGRADPSVYAPYEAGNIAIRFGDIFDRLAEDAGVSQCA